MLKSAAALAPALAGCQTLTEAVDRGPLDLGDTARGPMEDDPTAEWRASVSDVVVQSSAYANAEPERALRRASTHYLFAEIDGRLPPDYVGSYSIPYNLPGTFTAVVDGTVYEPTGEPFRPDGEVGAFSGYVFEVDATNGASEARIRWDVADRRHEWVVPETKLDAFERRPRATGVSVSSPDQAEAGDSIAVEVSGTNAGDPGRIRVGLYRRWNRNVDPMSAEVDAGERHTWTLDLETDVPSARTWEFRAITAGGERATDSTRVVK